MEHGFNQFLLEGKFNTPDRDYLAVLRELDRIPARMLKTIKAIKDLIRERGTSTNIEPIEDPPPAQPVHHRIHLQGILPPHGLATSCTQTQNTTTNRFRPLAIQSDPKKRGSKPKATSSIFASEIAPPRARDSASKDTNPLTAAQVL